MSIKNKKVRVDGDPLWYWYEEAVVPYKAERTVENTAKRIRVYRRWLASQGGYNHDCHWTDINLDDVSNEVMIDPREVTNTDIEAFLRDLTDAYSANGQHNITSSLRKAYSWLETKTEGVEDDVFSYVLELEEKDILDTPSGRNAYFLPIEDVRYYIRSWDRPRYSCTNQIAAKYTRRRGGISNLDFEDVNIDHPACQWSVRPEIRHWDDHILFRADKAASDDGRKSGNKTATTAKYPLDEELKRSLLWYLACRPEPNNSTDPLFLNQYFERLSGGSLSIAFRERSKEITQREEGPTCWYGPNDDDNVNPHYFRHWGTTWYQDHLEDGALVDYLRGDTGSGSKANYNQYSDIKRQKILDAMPKFFEPYIED